MSSKLFSYKEDELYGQKYSSLYFGHRPVRLADFVRDYRRPVIVYDRELIRERVGWIQGWKRLGRLHYAMKANFHPEILKLLQSLNCGVDVVSAGEIRHALAHGFGMGDIIFSGVGKSREELRWVIEEGIYQINVESFSELRKIAEIARERGREVSVGLRINPEIDAETHKSISTALKDSKFGMDFAAGREAVGLIAAEPLLKLKALSFHLGSQIMNVNVYEKALAVMKPYYREAQARCPELERFDLGGGIGIDYRDADSAEDRRRWQALEDLYERELAGFDAVFLLEIGRFLVARAGVLLSRVEIIKENPEKKFLILDAGMTHLMRPALYGAYHEILPLRLRPGARQIYDVVGPICESTDVLAAGRALSPVEEEDFVAICDVGAYGSVMASRYNLRDEALEIVL